MRRHAVSSHSIIWRSYISASLIDKIVGNSRVQPCFRVTLRKEIRKKLKIKVGDMVIYVEDERGNIILKKAELKPV